MHNTRKISRDYYWVGASDRRLELFENVMPITKGVSYNSYLLMDEKTAKKSNNKATKKKNPMKLLPEVAIDEEALLAGYPWIHQKDIEPEEHKKTAEKGNKIVDINADDYAAGKPLSIVEIKNRQGGAFKGGRTIVEVKKGKYAFYFNFMPVGKGADKALIPTPSQRKYMYFWLKKMRNGHTGKPLFVMDFQDDGEYVGGCIAGGRNYFHINSNGDIEPCVFIHFSDSNIRRDTLFEALNKPLFMAYRKGQPFNDNHLMPCPMLENPHILRELIKSTGAQSTDLIEKETADELCSKCDDFSKAWAPVAKDLWDNNPHPKTFTQYFRDTPEGKNEK